MTNEKIIKVLALYYGCPYVLNIKKKCIFKSGTIDATMIDFFIENDLLQNVRLILKPISKITGTHLIGLAKALDEYDGTVVTVPKKQVKYMAGIILEAAETDQLDYKTYQYLINNQYAVPIFFGIGDTDNGKNPIELKIAKEK